MALHNHRETDVPGLLKCFFLWVCGFGPDSGACYITKQGGWVGVMVVVVVVVKQEDKEDISELWEILPYRTSAAW